MNPCLALALVWFGSGLCFLVLLCLAAWANNRRRKARTYDDGGWTAGQGTTATDATYPPKIEGGE